MIALRAMAPMDKEMVRQWRNLPEVSRYMYTGHEISAEEHERWFQGVLAAPHCRYWIITCDGEDVGVANITAIDPRHRRCYWAFYLASPSVRGKGVGSFVEYWMLRHVFDDLNLNKLCCEVLSFNEAVINMHKSFGFREEGLFREHVVKEGQAVDVVCLAMLQREWQAAKPGIEERLRAKGLLP